MVDDALDGGGEDMVGTDRFEEVGGKESAVFLGLYVFVVADVV